MYSTISHLQTNENRTVQLATFLMLMASAVTFYASMSSFASFTKEDGLPLGAIIITAVITLLTVLSAYQYMVNKQMRYLVPYLLTLIFSVVTNTNYFTSAWNLDELVEQEKISSEQKRLNGFVSDFHQNINAAGLAFSSLAKYSEDTMRIESQYGGTCNDGNPYTVDDQQTGDGPRRRLRESDLKILSNFADDMQAIVKEVDSVSDALVGAQIADIYAATNKLNSLATHPLFANSKRWLQKRLRSGESYFIDPQSQQRFTCPDAAFAAKAQAVLDMSFAPVEIAEIHNSATDNSIILSIQLLINVMTFNWSDISLYQVFAVIFALGVDLSVMFASHLMTSNTALKTLKGWCTRHFDLIQQIQARSARRFNSHHIGIHESETVLLAFMHALSGAGLAKHRKKAKGPHRFVIRETVARKLFGYTALNQLNADI